jgi:hypothetical protein
MNPMSSTIAKPQIEIDKSIEELIQHQTERCTIVHCRFFSKELCGVRIWPSTFLIEDDGRKCRLIKAFNISVMPDWTEHFIVNNFIRFTLVFEGLSKTCMSFHLQEIIPEQYAFYTNEIKRNSTDVYSEEVLC